MVDARWSPVSQDYNVVRNRLREVFGNRIIGLGHAVEWPPRSPDQTPCDFLWGYLKNNVYETPPTDPQDKN